MCSVLEGVFKGYPYLEFERAREQTVRTRQTSFEQPRLFKCVLILLLLKDMFEGHSGLVFEHDFIDVIEQARDPSNSFEQGLFGRV